MQFKIVCFNIGMKNDGNITSDVYIYLVRQCIRYHDHLYIHSCIHHCVRRRFWSLFQIENMFIS